jgi:hypothetical protein
MITATLPITVYGDPGWKQGLKIWLARNRPGVWQTLRCYAGRHSPSPYTAFTCMGAICVGGPCLNCGDGVAREICWIGNVWDFPEVMADSSGGQTSTVAVDALTARLEEFGLTYIGDYPA